MASFNRIVFGGGNDTIPVPFAYLDKSHVQVSLDGVLQAPSAYTWPSNGQVKLSAGNPPSGTVGEVRRLTPSSPLVSFSPGNLDTNDLNVAATQSLLIAEEAKDLIGDVSVRGWVSAGFQSGGTIAKGGDGVVAAFDASGNIVPGPSSAQVANAQGYAEDALASMEAAEAASIGAASSEEMAQKWAVNPEDAVVAGGLYSAFHWYRKTLAIYNAVANTLAGWIHAATFKTSPAGADELPLSDSEASWGLKKLSLAGLVTWLHSVFGPDYIKGLTTSRTATFTVAIAAGQAKGNGKFVSNPASFSKSLNAVWVAGSGNGGRDHAGALVANKTYHLHALRKDSDGTFDALWSLSAVAPTVPSGYSWVSRIDWAYTNSGATDIWAYTQEGNNKYFTTFTPWFNTTTSIADALYSMPAAAPIPEGIRTFVSFNAAVTAAAGGSVNLYVTDGDVPTMTGTRLSVTANGGSSSSNASGAAKVKTDTSRRMRALATFSGNGGSLDTNVSHVEDFTLNRIY